MFPHQVALAVLMLLVLAPVLAQTQRIYAGAASGSYTIDFCPWVAATVRQAFFSHQCVASEGTNDNIRRVLAEPHSIGIGQLDVMADFIEFNPGQLTVIDPKIGYECLFAVSRTNNNLDRLASLSPEVSIALPPVLSGSAASFRFLQSLDEELAALRTITHHDSALDAVQAVAAGEADLAFFVQAANIDNPVFKTANDARLRFIPVISRDILQREAAGMAVYEPLEVGVTPTLFGFGTPRKIITTCTPVVVFTGNPALFPVRSEARNDQETLVRALTTVERPDSPVWRSIFQNMVEVGQDRLEALF